MSRKSAVSRFAAGAKGPRSFTARIKAERKKAGSVGPGFSLGIGMRPAPAR